MIFKDYVTYIETLQTKGSFRDEVSGFHGDVCNYGKCELHEGTRVAAFNAQRANVTRFIKDEEIAAQMIERFHMSEQALVEGRMRDAAIAISDIIGYFYDLSDRESTARKTRKAKQAN